MSVMTVAMALGMCDPERPYIEVLQQANRLGFKIAWQGHGFIVRPITGRRPRHRHNGGGSALFRAELRD